MRRKTKIIATLGPAVSDPYSIAQLVEAGMDVARLNFSHGTRQVHEQNLRWVHEASAKHGRSVAVLQDIQGPKIRVGEFPDGEVELVDGAEITVLPGSGTGDAERVYVAYLENVRMEVGGKILLADGLIELEALAVSDDAIRAKVVSGGVLADHKGAAFPGAVTTVPVVTDKDEDDLEFGRTLGFDLLADIGDRDLLAQGRTVQLESSAAPELAGVVPVRRPLLVDQTQSAKLGKGLGHALAAQLLELVQGGMGQHVVFPQ